MLKHIIGSLRAAALLLPIGSAWGQERQNAGKFAPPKGRTLVAVGGPRDGNVEMYRQATGHAPQGVKLFCGLKGEGDASHFRNNARQNDEEGRFLVVEYALDPAFPGESAKDSDKLTPFLRGEFDGGIDAMGRAVKEYGRPVFAAFGYEFDGQHPHQPREYAQVFRRIHDAWDRLGVTNVAYVWHSYTDNLNGFVPERNKTEAKLYEYYPGDKYVDYFGVSIYYETQRQGAARFARMARARGKPVAIIESGVGVNPDKFWDYSWGGYYAPLFEAVERLDAALFCYNNMGDDFNQFSEPGNPFRNTRMDRMPREVRDGWGRMMRQPRFRSVTTLTAPKDGRAAGAGGPNPSGRVGDLLKQIDVGRDSIAGDWTLAGGRLSFAGDQEWSRLMLPGSPPDEYDLTVVAERVDGTEILVIGLVVGGKQAMVLLDGWGGGVSGLERIDGEVSQDNETTQRGWRFVNGRRTTITCKVRKDGVVVNCDGKQIVTWRGDPGSLSLVEGWKVREENKLFLGGWKGGPFRFYKLEIRPVAHPGG